MFPFSCSCSSFFLDVDDDVVIIVVILHQWRRVKVVLKSVVDFLQLLKFGMLLFFICLLYFSFSLI